MSARTRYLSFASERIERLSAPSPDEWQSMSQKDRRRYRGERSKRSAMIDKLEALLRSCRNRAYDKAMEFNIDLGYVISVYDAQKGVCALTGIALTASAAARVPNGLSIDRIDSSDGYTVGNIQITTLWANQAKNKWDDDIFYAMCRAATRENEARKSSRTALKNEGKKAKNVE